MGLGLVIVEDSWSHWHTTLGRTPLDEWSARHRDSYLTIHNTQKRQASMPAGGIRTRNPSKRAATDARLRPRGHSLWWTRWKRVESARHAVCWENIFMYSAFLCVQDRRLLSLFRGLHRWKPVVCFQRWSDCLQVGHGGVITQDTDFQKQGTENIFAQ